MQAVSPKEIEEPTLPSITKEEEALVYEIMYRKNCGVQLIREYLEFVTRRRKQIDEFIRKAQAENCQN